MIEFKFVITNQGYGVEYKGKIIYDCRNRTKGYAWDEAVSYCSSYQGSSLVDCTHRKIKSIKHKTTAPTKLDALKELQDIYPSFEIRIECITFYPNYTIYEVELWGEIETLC
jgi:hypothetical protein